jgi:hypothetical protein
MNIPKQGRELPFPSEVTKVLSKKFFENTREQRKAI